jgi:hypothetical protein
VWNLKQHLLVEQTNEYAYYYHRFIIYMAAVFHLLPLPLLFSDMTTHGMETYSNYIYIRIYIYIYTGCPRRKGPKFGGVFLRSNYTDITQNTYIQSSMVTEILAREKCGLLW